MVRVKFRKQGQKEFLDLVKKRMFAPSIRSLLQFGFSTNYSSLKNYYSEKRLLPKNLFDEMVHLAKINVGDLEIEFIEDNWGQIKGGKNK